MAKEKVKPELESSIEEVVAEPVVVEEVSAVLPDMCNREELQIIADAAEARAKVVEVVKGPEFVYVVALRDIVESVRRLLEYNKARGHWGIENEGEEE